MAEINAEIQCRRLREEGDNPSRSMRIFITGTVRPVVLYSTSEIQNQKEIE